MPACMHACIKFQKQAMGFNKTPNDYVTVTMFPFFTVDQCGYELPSIYEAIQSIQDEFIVPVFTGCDLHTGPGRHRIYHYVRWYVSKNFCQRYTVSINENGFDTGLKNSYNKQDTWQCKLVFFSLFLHMYCAFFSVRVAKVSRKERWLLGLIWL